MKLKRDELLSSFAFKFNLRRYTKGPSITLDRLTPPTSMDSAGWVSPAALEAVAHSDLQLAERLSFACLQARRPAVIYINLSVGFGGSGFRV